MTLNHQETWHDLKREETFDSTNANEGFRIDRKVSMRESCTDAREPIPFVRPFETEWKSWLSENLDVAAMASDGPMAHHCTMFLQKKLGLRRVFLTPSCTASLEMCMRALNLKDGDEVIMPSFTFTSSANAVLLAGATPVFVDVRPDTLTIDEAAIEAAITPKTRAILVVHYAGVSSDMDWITAIANRHSIPVVEDAAQGVGAYYKDRALGGIGCLSAYSFHYTKNIMCGEGGAVCINDPLFDEFTSIYRDKGTNRQDFLSGQVNKYSWVGLGSSCTLSELSAALLFSQLQYMEEITTLRARAYENYINFLSPLIDIGVIELPTIPTYARSNYHIFYIMVKGKTDRNELIKYLTRRSISATMHYVPLHSAPMGLQCGRVAGNMFVTETAGANLVRLPLYPAITTDQQLYVCDAVMSYFRNLAI